MPDDAVSCAVWNYAYCKYQLIYLKRLRLDEITPEQLVEFSSDHRMAKIETLCLGATVLPKKLELLARLHALGYYVHLQAFPHADDGADESRVVIIRREITHK